MPVFAAPLVRFTSPSGCPSFAIALMPSATTPQDFPPSTHAGEMNTGIELFLPMIVVLASASATFRNIRGRNWTF